MYDADKDMGAAEVVREQTLAAAQVQQVVAADGVVHVIGSDRLKTIVTIDSEEYAPQPRRSKATIRVHNGDAFVQAVKQRTLATSTPVLYADEEHKALVAVLNDDHGDDPGWRDNRVELALRPTEPWLHWTNHQGLKPQDKFADIIDKGLPDLLTPPAAEMLELAQTFQATVGVRFRQQGRLRDGNRQLTYEEETSATAGAGAMSIPEMFTIGVAPYYGSRTYEVEANLRFQVRGADFTIGYFLVRPEDTEQKAFADVRTAVENGLGLAAVAGIAPEAR